MAAKLGTLGWKGALGLSRSLPDSVDRFCCVPYPSQTRLFISFVFSVLCACDGGGGTSQSPTMRAPPAVFAVPVIHACAQGARLLALSMRSPLPPCALCRRRLCMKALIIPMLHPNGPPPPLTSPMYPLPPPTHQPWVHTAPTPTPCFQTNREMV